MQETFERGEAILCENAKDDPRFMNAESLKQLETLSLVAVPMHSENRPVGVFYVESESAGNVFNSDDLEFLQEFAQTITPFVKFGITHQGHVREILKLKEEAIGRYDMGNIIGRSEAITGVFELVRIAAEVDRTVLITGESGSGKSVLSRTIIDILAKDGSVLYEGEVIFEGRDLRLLTEKEMREIRGREISMIFQDPMTSLNPVTVSYTHLTLPTNREV